MKIQMTDGIERYEFDDRLAMSQGTAGQGTIDDILLRTIPGATAVRNASRREDRHGTDKWVDHVRGEPLSIDMKVRSKDYAVSGDDDLALELWSVINTRNAEGTTLPARKIGWTRNPNKRTDYILWFWKDTGRFCLVPFPMLCSVFCDNWQAWENAYFAPKQFTPDGEGSAGWWSQCVFVPRHEVWAAIYHKFGGAPGK